MALTLGRNKKNMEIMSDDSIDEEDKIKEIQLAIEQSKDQVNQVIEKAVKRGDNLLDLEEKANNMKDLGGEFNKQARRARRTFWWRNLKVNILLLVIILVVALIIYLVLIHPLVRK